MKKILVIGSKGFIGTHCVNHFSGKNDVYKCDIVVDYDEPNYILLNPVNSNFDELFQEHNFDLCINCSGAASVPDSYKHTHRDFSLNTLNVFKQLDAIKKYNADCRYINLSSAAVYGNPVVLPVKESQELKPISPYGLHKKMAEELCVGFYRYFEVQTCSLRVFSAYGPGLKKQLFWDLAKKVRNNSHVELFGTGRESRDFVYISDIVDIIELVSEKADFKGENINIGNGVEERIDKVVDTFFSYFENPIKYSFMGENREGDPVNWVADIEIIKEFGYNPKISIETGLLKYYQWLAEQDLV